MSSSQTFSIGSHKPDGVVVTGAKSPLQAIDKPSGMSLMFTNMILQLPTNICMSTPTDDVTVTKQHDTPASAPPDDVMVTNQTPASAPPDDVMVTNQHDMPASAPSDDVMVTNQHDMPASAQPDDVMVTVSTPPDDVTAVNHHDMSVSTLPGTTTTPGSASVTRPTSDVFVLATCKQNSVATHADSVSSSGDNSPSDSTDAPTHPDNRIFSSCSDLPLWANPLKNAYTSAGYVHGFVDDDTQLEVVLEWHCRA